MVGDITQDSKWLELFLDFIAHINIDSKEAGVTNLRKKMYGAQLRLLEQMDDGMREKVRHFVVLKARQLGITTISLALDLFWVMIFPGLQGAIVFDTEGNKEKARILVGRMFESLPKHVTGKIQITKNNRNNLVLNNGSVLDYLVAGTKKGNSGLGRSRALNFVHATECSSYGDPEQVASLMASMAEKHPDRLYIFESTAKGFNLFYEMWDSAENDPKSQKAIFLGWWSKEDYRLEKDDNKFEDYWDGILTEDEKLVQEEVLESYGHAIEPEQWAWYRWKAATRVSQEGMMQQEFPSTAEEAFISTGSSFFPKAKIDHALISLKEQNRPFKAYRYNMGADFTATDIEPVTTSWEADLKIWEGPVENGEYIIGCDPAYGRNDNKDRHCIQVWRAYADRLVQCAEYATPNPETYQAAWVLAHLAGFYKTAVLILEIQGPGQAIQRELQNLRHQFQMGLVRGKHSEDARGLKDVFGLVRWYIDTKYDRPNQQSGMYHWQTNINTKLIIMNQVRDAFAMNQLDIRSQLLLEEMQRVVQDGAQIEADGRAKDDRVFATALVVRAWIDSCRSSLMLRGMTQEKVQRDEHIAKNDPRATMVGNVLAQFKAEQERNKSRARINARWNRPRRP